MNADRLRAAMALPGFAWHEGMLGRLGDWWGRVISVHEGHVVWHVEDSVAGHTRPWPSDALPVVEDDATGGCLFELLGRGVKAGRGDKGGWWCDHAEPDAVLAAPNHAYHIAAGASLGEACVEVALARGRWPGCEP